MLPGRVLFALVLLTVSFCVLLHRRPLNVPVAVLHLGILIFMLYGMTSFIEEVPRFAVSWRHAGVADYLVQHGSVDPKIDAYFNWPGFFALAAMFTKLTGYKNPIALAAGAPIYFNLLYLGAVAMIMRSATSDARVVWLGSWIFFISNWVGQDYFSPQALSYFIHLMILGLLLTWFRRERYRSADGDAADTALLPSGTAWQRVGLLAVAIILFASIVPSHQLTPFATVASVVALVVFRRTTARGLYLLMLVLLVTWISFAAVSYLSGHIARLTSDVGNVSGNTTANVSERLTGSPDHLFVIRIRLVMTAGLWGLALLGLTRRLGRGHRDLTFAVLALAPFPLLGLQGYGGEMLLRVYLFSLPFVAFFVASLFYPSLTSRSSWVDDRARHPGVALRPRLVPVRPLRQREGQPVHRAGAPGRRPAVQGRAQGGAARRRLGQRAVAIAGLQRLPLPHPHQGGGRRGTEPAAPGRPADGDAATAGRLRVRDPRPLAEDLHRPARHLAARHPQPAGAADLQLAPLRPGVLERRRHHLPTRQEREGRSR